MEGRHASWKPIVTPLRLLLWLAAFVSLAAATTALMFEAFSTTQWTLGQILLVCFLIFAAASGFIYLGVVQVLKLLSERQELKEQLWKAEENNEKALRRIEAVFQIHQKFVETADESEIIDLALQSAVGLAGASSAMYVPLDERGQPMAAIPYGQQPYPIPDVWTEYLASPAVRERCRVCDKEHPLSETCPLMAGPFQGAAGMFCLPLKRGDREFGVINLHVPEAGKFDEETQGFLRAIADQTALALEGHRLRKRELQTFQQLQAVRNRTDLRCQLTDLVENARQMLEADFVVLHLPESIQRVPTKPTGSPDQPEVLIGGEASEAVLKFIDGFVQGVMKSNEPVLIGNVVSEASSGKKNQAVHSVRAIMAAPLSTAVGSPQGVMLAGSHKSQSFNSRQLAVLQSIAGQVALVLNTANQMADVQFQSMMDERTRLAREIHDGLAQTLGFLKLQMSQMHGYLDRGEMERLDKAMKVIYQTLSEAYQEARYAIDGLRIAPEDSGYGWVDQILAEFNDNTAGNGPEAVLSENEVGVQIAPEVQAQLIRILQEALSNVRKHAEATRVLVSFCEEEGDVVLEVQDNGVGFSSDEVAGPSRHGLRGMRERADLIGAEFQVMSRPEQGTTVRVSLPLRQGELEK